MTKQNALACLVLACVPFAVLGCATAGAGATAAGASMAAGAAADAAGAVANATGGAVNGVATVLTPSNPANTAPQVIDTPTATVITSNGQTTIVMKPRPIYVSPDEASAAPQ